LRKLVIYRMGQLRSLKLSCPHLRDLQLQDIPRLEQVRLNVPELDAMQLHDTMTPFDCTFDIQSHMLRLETLSFGAFDGKATTLLLLLLTNAPNLRALSCHTVILSDVASSLMELCPRLLYISSSIPAQQFLDAFGTVVNLRTNGSSDLCRVFSDIEDAQHPPPISQQLWRSI